MPSLGWRWLLAFSSLPSFALLLFYPLTLESPRYLCMKGRTADAVQVLETMARLNRVALPSGHLMSGHRMELHELTDSSETSQLLSAKKTNPAAHSSKTEIGGRNAILKLLSPNLIRSSLLLWTVFLGHAFLYYGLVLLTSELSHGNKICGSEGIVTMQTNHSNDANLYRNVFITSFGGTCVSPLGFTIFLENVLLHVITFISHCCRGSWPYTICGNSGQDWAQTLNVLYALYQLPVHSSPYGPSNRVPDNYLPVRCTHLHLRKLHCLAHLCSWGLFDHSQHPQYLVTSLATIKREIKSQTIASCIIFFPCRYTQPQSGLPESGLRAQSLVSVGSCALLWPLVWCTPAIRLQPSWYSSRWCSSQVLQSHTFPWKQAAGNWVTTSRRKS